MKEEEIVQRLHEIDEDPAFKVIFEASRRAVQAKLPRIEAHFAGQTKQDIQAMQQHGEEHKKTVEMLRTWVDTVKQQNATSGQE